VRLLIAEELAAALRVSRWHAYELMRRKAIRTVRIGRLRRVREEDLQRFIERRSRPTGFDGKDGRRERVVSR
jgi:excisionase family DNA binding protein